ncbi:MAG: FG-GAP repeat protein [Calditrichales bacterium]|nr:FG-GAP repeat protein [Calditrichales bacterium]
MTTSDGAAEGWFGKSVSISGDYALIGASNNNDNGSVILDFCKIKL